MSDETAFQSVGMLVTVTLVETLAGFLRALSWSMVALAVALVLARTR